jgi:hypothetical protein
MKSGNSAPLALCFDHHDVPAVQHKMKQV